MEVNIQDYLSNNEIKEIVKEQFANRVSKIFNTEYDTERIIGNLSYKFIWKVVDEEIGDNFQNRIKEKVVKIINDLTDFCVFRRKSDYEKEESIGQKILNEAVQENADIIKNKVKKHLENLDDEYIINQAVTNAVIQKIMS